MPFPLLICFFSLIFSKPSKGEGKAFPWLLWHLSYQFRNTVCLVHFCEPGHVSPTSQGHLTISCPWMGQLPVHKPLQSWLKKLGKPWTRTLCLHRSKGRAVYHGKKVSGQALRTCPLLGKVTMLLNVKVRLECNIACHLSIKPKEGKCRRSTSTGT